MFGCIFQKKLIGSRYFDRPETLKHLGLCCDGLKSARKKTTGHAASFIRLLNHDAQDFMWKKLSLLFGSISHFHRTIDIIDTIFEH